MTDVLKEIRKIFRKDSKPAEYDTVMEMAVAAEWSENDATFVEVAHAMSELNRQHDVARQEIRRYEDEMSDVKKHRSDVMKELMRGTRQIEKTRESVVEAREIIRHLKEKNGM